MRWQRTIPEHLRTLCFFFTTYDYSRHTSMPFQLMSTNLIECLVTTLNPSLQYSIATKFGFPLTFSQNILSFLKPLFSLIHNHVYLLSFFPCFSNDTPWSDLLTPLCICYEEPTACKASPNTVCLISAGPCLVPGAPNRQFHPTLQQRMGHHAASSRRRTHLPAANAHAAGTRCRVHCR